MHNLKIFIAVLLLSAASGVHSQVEGDRVIAVIGNDIITESDFQYQIQIYARQNQLTELNPFIAQQIFQSMLSNKIILAKAQQDSVIVSEDEVTKELEGRIKGLVAQAGSEERLVEVYGMSLSKIKILLREDLQKSIMIERMKRKKFQNAMRVSDKEVRDFFNTYKDSLPAMNDEFELAHIILERKVSDAEKTEAKKIALEILDSIKQGVDFSELARRNSADSLSAINGGDLGFAKKGTFVKEFEETVFNLDPGEVSDIVETQFGYHIIKLNEIKGDEVKSQHILIRYPKFESSDFETIAFLKDLRSQINSGQITFDSAAKLYSEDDATKFKSGYIGIVPVEQIDSFVVESLKTLSEGETSDPLRVGNDMNYGYEIYKLIKFYPSHPYTLSGDYDRIKKFAIAYKENKEMENWINEIKETIYVDIRM